MQITQLLKHSSRSRKTHKAYVSYKYTRIIPNYFLNLFFFKF